MRVGARRVVVTGASSGIGAATVRLFRERGWNVVGVARRTDRLQKLAAETGADVFTADVTDQAQVDALREYLVELGPVHALVNNAGGALGVESVENSPADDWTRMFDVNVVAVKRVITALLPLLRKATLETGSAEAGSAEAGSVDSGGVNSRDVPHADILTITSIAGHTPYEGGGGYNAAKFAAHALMGVLRLELAGEPIRVIEIAPGMVKTEEFSLVRLRGDQARAEAVYDNVPNPLYAEDIAEAIVHAIELPGHVNLDVVTIKPVAQAAPHKVARGVLSPRL